MNRLFEGLAVAALIMAAAVPARAAGIALIDVPGDAARPAMSGAVWYPCAAPPQDVPSGATSLRGVKDCPVTGTNHPLVVISHGFHGSFVGHHDVAEALADAGFVVAAISHPDDSGRTPDSQHKQVFAALTDRPADISRLIDFMLGAPAFAAAIDRDRIGFFGFSRGGFTGLALIGGTVDFHKTTATLCADSWVPFACEEYLGRSIPGEAPAHDPRIKAAVIADPLFGRFYGGLDQVQVPVQLWASEFGGDGVVPDDAATAARNMRVKPEFHTVPKSAHFAFLPPCNQKQAEAFPEACTDRPDFDRVAFHAQFDAQIVAFMHAHLVSQQ